MPWSKGCSVGGCKNNGSSRPSGTSMHRFPRNEALREAWTTFVNLSRSKSNWKPTKCKYICSEHFSQDCFDSKHRFFVTLGLPSQKKNLLAGAIPSILPAKVTSYAEETIEKNVDGRVETFHQCVVCDQMFQNASVLEIHSTQHKENSNNEHSNIIPDEEICDEEIKLGFMETDLDEYNEPPIIHFKEERLIKNISHHCIHCKKSFWQYTDLEEHACSGSQTLVHEKESKTSVSPPRTILTESAEPCTKLEDTCTVINMSFEPHSEHKEPKENPVINTNFKSRSEHIDENQKDEEAQIYDEWEDIKNVNLVSEDGCTNESSASSSVPFGVSNDPFNFQQHSDTESNISDQIHVQESKHDPSLECENKVCDKCFQQYSDLRQHICIQDHFIGTFNFNNRNDTDNILDSTQSTGATDDSKTTMESDDTLSYKCLHSTSTLATQSQAGTNDSETTMESDYTLSHGCLHSTATLATQSQASTDDLETTTGSDDTLSYKCLHCDDSFSFFKDLCQHTCTEEKAIKNSDQSNISGKNYIVFSGLNNQTKSHGQFFKCDVCEHAFREQNSLVKHMKVYACNGTKKNLFRREKCFSPKYSATGKMKTDAGEKKSKCKICSKTFVSDIWVTMVKSRTVLGVKHYKCSVCHKSFLHKFNAKKHMNEVHSRNEQSSKCKVCEFMAVTAQNRRQRIDRETFLTCGVCNESFKESRAFMMHVRIHKSKRHFFCSVCRKSFASKNSLRQHRLVHSVSECYECIFCGHSFSELDNLQMHIHNEH
ncbi:zinc finger protein 611 [Patella vulgata]|uniref:zinc finger protein 611 n=1 Tax=Patella vulgata TaxID=6465 RepID=UPI0021800F6D|nr:zinc finger protein 611 [Patella vulgata]